MPIDVENVTFTLSAVVQLAGYLIAILSAWFWLRGQFQRNTDRLTRVETDLSEHAAASTISINKLGKKIDNLSDSMTRFDSRGQVLEEKFAHLEMTVVQIDTRGQVLDEKLSALITAMVAR